MGLRSGVTKFNSHSDGLYIEIPKTGQSRVVRNLRSIFALPPRPNRTGSEPMPIILWLLGVPLTLVILLVLLGVV